MDEKMGDLSKKCFLLLQVLGPYANRNLRKLRLIDFFPKCQILIPIYMRERFFKEGFCGRGPAIHEAISAVGFLLVFGR
jgi:hypothetical protein